MICADTAVSRHYLLFRCAPVSNDCQIVKSINTKQIGFDFINTSFDSFGNSIMYGGTFNEHLSLYWSCDGVVSLTPYLIKNTEQILIYAFNTQMTAVDESILEFIESIKPCNSVLDFVFKIMEKVHEALVYTQNVTDSRTRAYEAYALKKGVCQDYAHLMICILRKFNIPCRYVNGFIEGEGQTHAWVDVLIDGFWHGFDPTHNRKIEYGYISLAHGRDASDCSVSRGVFSSKSNNRMSAFVCVGRL